MPTPPITLREATQADHPILRSFNDRLIAAASLPGATSADFARFQATFTDKALSDSNPKSRCLVAVDNAGTILGYIHLQPTHDDILDREIGYVSIIAVAENASGQGIGRLLMRAAENWAKAQGYPALVLDVFSSNASAHAFYTKNGFGEDSLRLRRTLL